MMFRDEALLARSRGSGVPDVAGRLGAAWISWLYRLALVLVAAGVVVTMTATTPQESYGTAVVSQPDGRFAALLPVAVVPDLIHARTLAVVLNGSAPIRITGARARLAEPSLVREAGLPQPAQPSILLTGRMPPGQVPALAGRGTRVITSLALVTRTQPVGAIVVREFEVMLGKGGAGS